MDKDSAARIELGRSFHQMGTVNEKVHESDFVPLWDGTVMCGSLAEHKHVGDGWNHQDGMRGIELSVISIAVIWKAMFLNDRT